MESYILAFSQSIPHTKPGIICINTVTYHNAICCAHCGDHYNQGKQSYVAMRYIRGFAATALACSAHTS